MHSLKYYPTNMLLNISVAPSVKLTANSPFQQDFSPTFLWLILNICVKFSKMSSFPEKWLPRFRLAQRTSLS